MTEPVIRRCVMCDGTGKDQMFAVPNPARCRVCGGKGRTAHRWEGDTFIPMDPDGALQRALTLEAE